MSRAAAGLRRRLGQTARSMACHATAGQRAPVERAAGGLDAVAGRGVQILRLVLEPGEQPFAQRAQRFGDAAQRAGEPLGRLGDSGREREQVALQRAAGPASRRAARAST